MVFTMSHASDNPLDTFIEGWGRMGTHWGVGKMMAEIQALLYLSPRPLCLEEMAERLKASRSNISLNVRSLQDLGVVRKVVVQGDRRDFYTAEQDIAKVARRLAAEKRKRELDPALAIVGRALEAVRRGDLGDTPPIDTTRLDELKRLLEAIGCFFDSFIEKKEPKVAERDIVPAQNI